jgi:chlorite dismutase
MTIPQTAHRPETLEGWFALHQIFRLTRPKLDETRLARMSNAGIADAGIADASGPGKTASKARSKKGGSTEGWSCAVRLIGSTSDLMVIHFRDTLDAIGAAQSDLARSELGGIVERVYSFLSVAEAGLYHITAELARAATSRGGTIGDEEYRRALTERATAEGSLPHVRRRLYPELPTDMPYVSFYPMSKRRDAIQNWYTLTLDERSRLMQAHGLTGRRYAGKVQQVITGAIGLDRWEWGVTLFARDPLEFKKLVTDMRFDEVSAKYAEFGDFYVGRIISG